MEALIGKVSDEVKAYQIGLDVGKLHDPTAIAVARVVRERHRREKKDGIGVEDFYQYAFEVPFLERLPLDQNYRAIGARVTEVCSGVIDRADEEHRRLSKGFDAPAQHSTPVYLIMDATGVGQAVGDIISEQLPSRCFFTYATLTSGREITGSLYSTMSVGKFALISGLAAKLETDRIRIAKGTIDAEALQQELRDFEATMTAHGNIQSGARSGSHDDLVIALGLATCVEANIGGAVGSVQMPW